MDSGGKYFYIRDEDTVWNPGWKPCKTTLDAYECRHGMGYTVIRGSKNGIEAEVLCFVPLKTQAEVQKLTLRNQSGTTKKLKLFSFVEWCLWNAATDMENFQRNFSTGEVEVDGSVIYHKTEYRERRNHYAYYSVNQPVDGYDTDRETFFGLYNGFDEPQTVMDGTPRNSVAHGWSPVASHCLENELNPGESKELVLCGFPRIQTKNGKRHHHKTSDSAYCPRTAKSGRSFFRIADLQVYLLSNFNCETQINRRMVNTWNQYQCMITSASPVRPILRSGIARHGLP